jgi:hypothetical protein
MNTARLFFLSAITAIIVGATSAYAAPCESVASASASTAYQKVDGMLGEKIVAAHLQAIGLSSQQAQARLSQLSERQLSELAAQADMIHAGGTIQDGDTHPGGPFWYIGHQFCLFCDDIYRLLFTWQDLKI